MEQARETKKDDIDFLYDLYFLYNKTGLIDNSIDVAKSFLELTTKKHGKDASNYPNIAASYNNLGEAFRDKGDYNQAIEHHRLALEMRKLIHASTPNHPDIAGSYNNLGNAFSDKGEYDQAIEHHILALEIKKLAYASTPHHPSIATSHNNLGNAFKDMGEYDQAVKHHKLALEIKKLAYASTPNHPDIADSYNNLGNVFSNKGDYDQAIKHFNIALEIRKFAYTSTPNHPDIAQSYNNLSLVLINKAQYEKALEYAFKTGNKVLYDLITALCGNQSLLEGDHHKAREWYAQIDPIYQLLDFNSKDFIELQLRYANMACNGNLPSAAVNIQKILVNVDFDLQYGKIEKNSVCDKLLHMIKEKNATITINPKVLANYLLIINPVHIREGDNIENLLNSLQSICDNGKDKISFELLAAEISLLLPLVILIAMIAPLLLIIICNLNPINQP